MNLEELKAKRDARIKAKKERIKLDLGDTAPVTGGETAEKIEEKK